LQKLKSLLVTITLIVLSSSILIAQPYRYNKFKANRLMDLTLEISTSGLLKKDALLSMEADSVIKEWINNSFDRDIADHVKDNTDLFTKILSYKESRKDVLGAMKGMKKVYTNEKNQSLVDACNKRALVGASYVDIYDASDDNYFGVLLILFK
jgi:hypothetical protein